VRFIFDFAGNRPCVINVSLGTNAGPHDGSTLVEEGIDRMIRQSANRAVCIAASNSFNDGIHATGQVPAAGTLDLSWSIPLRDVTNNQLDLWYPGTGSLTVEILTPSGTSIVTVQPGQNRAVTGANGKTVLYVSNRLNDPNNGDNHLGIFLEHDL